MNILKRLFKSRDKPKITNNFRSNMFSTLIGNSSSGKNVNEQTALQVTAVFACIRILSEAIAGLPLNTYGYNEKREKIKATEHPIYYLLHDQPNPEMTSFVFRETLMSHLLL